MWKYARKQELLFGLVFCLAILLNNSYAEEYKLAQDFKFGHCPITGSQIITSDGRILPNYRIVWFELSNGSRMPLPVDVNAVDIINETMYSRIMEWVRAGWMFEINKKKWTPKQIQDYRDAFFILTIIGRVE